MSEIVKSPPGRSELHFNASGAGELESNSFNYGWSLRKKAVIGAILCLGIIGLIVGYYVQRSARLIFALQGEMKAVNSGTPSPIVKLPMEEAYDISFLHNDVSMCWHSEDKLEFLKLAEPQEEEISKLADLMTGTRYKEDWETGVALLNVKVPENNLINLNAPCVNYQQMRKFSNIISVISTYYGYKGESRKSALLVKPNVSLIRQFISKANENNGVMLIDAMIAIAMINNVKKTVEKTKGFNGWDSSLFPLLREPLESLDSLFPLVGPSLLIERRMLPSFFTRFNERASSKLGAGTVVIDQGWMNEQLDYYYAPSETFEMPYVEALEVMNKYNERLMKSSELTSGAGFYLTGLTSPFKAVFQVLVAIAVPNYVKAYKRECEARADLRGVYLAFAIQNYKGKNGEFPESLDELKNFVNEKMLIDPYSGEQFNYERRFDKVELTTERDGQSVVYLDI